jgi:hypothetical protein
MFLMFGLRPEKAWEYRPAINRGIDLPSAAAR